MTKAVVISSVSPAFEGMTSSKNSSWLPLHASNSLLQSGFVVSKAHGHHLDDRTQNFHYLVTWLESHQIALNQALFQRPRAWPFCRSTNPQARICVKRAWPNGCHIKSQIPFITSNLQGLSKHKRLNSPIFSAVAPCISSIWLL